MRFVTPRQAANCWERPASKTELPDGSPSSNLPTLAAALLRNIFRKSLNQDSAARVIDPAWDSPFVGRSCSNTGATSRWKAVWEGVQRSAWSFRSYDH